MTYLAVVIATAERSSHELLTAKPPVTTSLLCHRLGVVGFKRALANVVRQIHVTWKLLKRSLLWQLPHHRTVSTETVLFLWRNVKATSWKVAGEKVTLDQLVNRLRHLPKSLSTASSGVGTGVSSDSGGRQSLAQRPPSSSRSNPAMPNERSDFADRHNYVSNGEVDVISINKGLAHRWLGRFVRLLVNIFLLIYVTGRWPTVLHFQLNELRTEWRVILFVLFE